MVQRFKAGACFTLRVPVNASPKVIETLNQLKIGHNRDFGTQVFELLKLGIEVHKPTITHIVPSGNAVSRN